jgi:hypothetical protein
MEGIAFLFHLRQRTRPATGKARTARVRAEGSGTPLPPPLPGVTVTRALRLPALTAPGGPGGVYVPIVTE